jgi:hypothetical protein
MDAKHRQTCGVMRTAKSCGTKFLQRLQRVRFRNFKSKAALESYICSCPLLPEVREKWSRRLRANFGKRARVRPWAGAKSCGTFRKATVTNKVMDTGESTEQPLTPSRRECRLFGFTCVDYTCVLFAIAHKAAGAAKHPAFPAPSFLRVMFCTTRADHAAGVPNRALRHCEERSERSNPGRYAGYGLLRFARNDGAGCLTS